MTKIYLAKKTISLSLIILTLIQTYITVKEIIFVFPQISFFGDLATAQSLYFTLLKKALVISLGLFIDFFYGMTLFIKPIATTKLIHIIIGIFIFIFSFITFHTSTIDLLLKNLL